jgi:hypothetical protein
MTKRGGAPAPFPVHASIRGFGRSPRPHEEVVAVTHRPLARPLVLAAALIVTALLAHPPVGDAAVIPGLFNTGVDGTGTVLPDSSVDPHYALIVSPDGAYPGPSTYVSDPIAGGYWMANTTLSKWISPAVAEGYPSGGTSHAGGDYTYRLTFDLAGFDTASVVVSGGWAADNSGPRLLLNGNVTGFTCGSYSGLAPFTLTSGFLPGLNTLDFVVHNIAAGGSNPTGLRVQGLTGSGDPVTGVGPWREPAGLDLSAPFPNPVHGLARFAFSLARSGTVRLRVRDLAGRTVRTLADGSYAAGRFEASWDGRAQGGAPCAAGLYFVELESGGARRSRPIVWMR